MQAALLQQAPICRNAFTDRPLSRQQSRRARQISIRTSAQAASVDAVEERVSKLLCRTSVMHRQYNTDLDLALILIRYRGSIEWVSMNSVF